jgi:cobalt ECF transporter T component CbiQ
VDRTLDRLARVLGQLTLAQDGAGRGLLQRLDARVLLLAMVAVLLALGFVRHPLVLVGACLVTVALARASAVPVRAFLGRIGLAPVVAALVVAPATLSVVTPGLVVLPLWTWGGVSQGLTAQGLSSAAVLVARVASSVAVVMLVTATTAWTRLVAALGALGVPRVFVMLIAMAYRYLTLLLDVAAEMYTSRRARTLTVVSHARAGRSLLGASAGALVTKAHHLSDEVHQAMVARGYRGRARTLDGFRVGPADLAGAAATVGLVAGLLLADGALGR